MDSSRLRPWHGCGGDHSATNRCAEGTHDNIVEGQVHIERPVALQRFTEAESGRPIDVKTPCAVAATQAEATMQCTHSEFHA